jgi:hypothetical protein
MNFGENHKKNVVCHIHCKILHKRIKRAKKQKEYVQRTHS